MRVSRTAKVVLFDFDGVIIRPGDHNRLEWEHFGRTYGFATPEGISDAVLGLSTEQSLIELSKLPHHRPFDVKQALVEYDAHSLANNDGIAVTPGADALLRGLPRDRWAIVTTSSRDVTLNRLQHFGLPIPAVLVSADDVPKGQGKPMPTPYLLAMDALRVTPRDVAVVEDSPTGIEAAHRARSGSLIVMQGDVESSRIDLRRGECVIPDFEAMTITASDQALVIECEALTVGKRSVTRAGGLESR